MSNVNSDVYVLRLSNTSNGDDTTNPLLSLDADKNEYTINIPSRIQSKGKCFIKVISGLMSLEFNGDNTKRIIPSKTTSVFWQSNIPYLGFDMENRGSANAMLGSAVCIGSANSDEVVHIDSVEGRTFTCPSLPERISIKKLYTSATPAEVGPGARPANNGNLLPANEYTTTLLPCEVVLEVTFDEDMSVLTNREFHSIRN